MDLKERIDLDPKYLEIYHICGVMEFAKTYRYITEYVISDEKEIAVRETELHNFEIGVWCTGLRHMRITEYLENIGAEWN